MTSGTESKTLTRSERLQKSFDFIKEFTNQPIGLAAILADTSGDNNDYVGKIFEPQDEIGILGFLQDYEGDRNIYYHVNPMRDMTVVKSSLSNVDRVDYFHVDLDPRLNEDLLSEQRRIVSMLTDKLPSDIPPPTYIVFSGGGYQALWKLDKPIPLEGEAEAKDIGRYNERLALVLGAIDSCHSVDHLMRLPWTTNLPSARKRAKGRAPTVSTLVRYDPTLVHSREGFRQTEIQEIGSINRARGDFTALNGPAEQITDLSELDKYKVPARLKELIKEGRVAAEKRKDDSRSSWLFECIRELVKCKVPDTIIYGIITDKKWMISDSVLDKGNVERYALRQIHRAHDFDESPDLDAMNQDFCIISNYHGRCVVMDLTISPQTNKPRYSTQSFEEFQKRFSHVKINIIGANNQTRQVQKGKWWLEHPRRRQYDDAVFAPMEDVQGCFNLWKGFAIDPVPGDFSLFSEHVFENICDGNKAHFDYLFKWMARAVQKPGEPGRTAVVLRGAEGTGKGVFASNLGRLFGDHYTYVGGKTGRITGRFNSMLETTIFLFADEASITDPAQSDILKSLITEDKIDIEGKYLNSTLVQNCVHLIMASNNTWVVPAGPEARRYFVLDVGEKKKQNNRYFQAVQAAMDHGGRAALLHHLMEMEISDFDVYKIPKSHALETQRKLSMGRIETWWFDCLSSGMFTREHQQQWSEKSQYISVNDLYAAMMESMTRTVVIKRVEFVERFGWLINEGTKRATVNTRISPPWAPVERGERKTDCFLVPRLDVCRERFNNLFNISEFKSEDVEIDRSNETSIPF